MEAKNFDGLKDVFKMMIGEMFANSPDWELDNFDKKTWQCPKIAILRRTNWANLFTYFEHPEAVKTLIYTTNTIGDFNM